MPVGSPVRGSFSTLPGPSGRKSLSMPLSLSASELSEASGPGFEQHGILRSNLVELVPRRDSAVPSSG